MQDLTLEAKIELAFVVPDVLEWHHVHFDSGEKNYMQIRESRFKQARTLEVQVVTDKTHTPEAVEGCAKYLERRGY